jgi:hypothetical protein
MIENKYLFGACLNTLPYDLPHKFRIRISCPFRKYIPSDIGFDGHFLAAFLRLLTQPDRRSFRSSMKKVRQTAIRVFRQAPHPEAPTCREIFERMFFYPYLASSFLIYELE